jgi:hypothetical protein
MITNSLLSGTLSSHTLFNTSLVQLAVWKSRISGSIPPVSAPALKQKIIDLSDCRISATLPQSIGALSGLKAWITKGNWGISGTLPSSVGNIQDDSWTFESVWHNSTNATSDLFCTRCGNVSLTHWLHWSSALSGTIPPEFGSLHELETLMMFNNSLSGSLPLTLRTQTDLVVMLLYQNHLTGHLEPGNQPLGPNLQWLLLHSNQIRWLLIPLSCAVW